MKRLFLCLTLVLAACLNAAAQTNLIASLSHNDKLTAYYGEEALKEAYAAAQDGDVITLSSGTFSCPDTIRKAISLKGAGMANHGQTPSTMVKGDIVLIGQQGKKQMAVEGIHFMGIAKASGNGLKDEVTFLKCRLKAMAYNVFAKYISCLLQGGVDLGNQYYVTPTQAYCTNCIINSSILGSEPERSITIDHCIANCYTLTDRLTAMNSVIIYSGNYGNSKANFSHCVGVSTSQDADYFEFCPDGDNLMIYGYENLFKTWRGDDNMFDLTELFDLTDEAAAKYLGDDDTQVGIHGGSAPFDPLPSTAQVKKYGVKTAQDADGNIKVTINVE